jgi:hypothetical protein
VERTVRAAVTVAASSLGGWNGTVQAQLGGCNGHERQEREQDQMSHHEQDLAAISRIISAAGWARNAPSDLTIQSLPAQPEFRILPVFFAGAA